MPRTATPRRWVPLFLTLTLLGTLAIVLPLVYNLGQQLRPEQLAAARALRKSFSRLRRETLLRRSKTPTIEPFRCFANELCT